MPLFVAVHTLITTRIGRYKQALQAGLSSWTAAGPCRLGQTKCQRRRCTTPTREGGRKSAVTQIECASWPDQPTKQEKHYVTISTLIHVSLYAQEEIKMARMCCRQIDDRSIGVYDKCP